MSEVNPGFKCMRCGKPAEVENEDIGGLYCKPCHAYITKADPKLEAVYNKRRSNQK